MLWEHPERVKSTVYAALLQVLLHSLFECAQVLHNWCPHLCMCETVIKVEQLGLPSSNVCCVMQIKKEIKRMEKL